jgi:hypothetical protein
MTLFQRYQRLNIWNKLGVIASILTVITFFVWIIPKDQKPAPPAKQVFQTSVNSPGSVQIGGDVTINPDPKLEIQRNLRQHIRTLLAQINPEILKQVDSGAPFVTAFLSQKHAGTLSDFAEFPEFKNYLEYKSNHSVISGSNNHIGDGINDVSDDGFLSGFVLFIKDPLREPKNSK